MIILTIVKEDPNGLHTTFASIRRAVDAGLVVTRWVIKLSSPTDRSLAQLPDLPTFARVIRDPDTGIYDGMNQAVAAAGDLPGGSFVLLLNAGDALHPSIARWFDPSMAEDVTVLIGVAQRVPGDDIRPIKPIIGRGGLNFCHQAALFRLSTLRDHPFPTSFAIAGDYAQFLRIRRERIRIVDDMVAIYDMEGLSERSVIRTRWDNFRAGVAERGLFEIPNLILMLAIRAALRLRRPIASANEVQDAR